MKSYFIPRNFSDNGRILGMFESRHVLQAAVWSVPLTFLLLSISFLPFQIKAIVWGIMVGCPCMVILSGMLDKIIYMLRFKKEARLYITSIARRP